VGACACACVFVCVSKSGWKLYGTLGFAAIQALSSVELTLQHTEWPSQQAMRMSH
jgi:hypothetical protein